MNEINYKNILVFEKSRNKVEKCEMNHKVSAHS